MTGRNLRVAVTENERESAFAIIHLELCRGMAESFGNCRPGETHDLPTGVNGESFCLEKGEYLGAANFDPAVLENIQACLVNLKNLGVGKNLKGGSVHLCTPGERFWGSLLNFNQKSRIIILNCRGESSSLVCQRTLCSLNVPWNLEPCVAPVRCPERSKQQDLVTAGSWRRSWTSHNFTMH
jgi:hypothetical protein